MVDVQGGRHTAGLAPFRAAWVAGASALWLAGAAAAQDAPAPAPCTAALAWVVSVQGAVEVRRAAGPQARDDRAWSTVTLDTGLCSGDTVRVRSHGRAALRLNNETTLRLDQGTVLTLAPPDRDKPTLLEQLGGALHVMTRTRRPFNVRTPFVNANIEGTEFTVRVDAASTTVSVVEGSLVASNSAGTQRVGSLEQVVASQDEQAGAPRKSILLQPEDAVKWTLYVPAVIGRLDETLDALGPGPEGTGRAAFLVRRAALLLQVGRLDEAGPDLAEARRLDPRGSNAPALQAIAALVQNDKAAALALAREATALDGSSPGAWIAMSYVQQADFQIEAALDSAMLALQNDPDNALAHARRAELEMSLGRLDAALQSARRAANLEPRLARAQTLLGFAQLVRLEAASARQTFLNAIALDQADPLPRLGLGLARIRQGALQQGREEIEIAAILDPLDSNVRSYLGKAYFEEKRDGLAATQFTLAETRDPLDPTPHLYDAIRKQTTNRPVEALQDLEHSIELNDNRAVYRSRLLIDDDAAARGVSLARVYQDLGFDRLAIVEAVQSLSRDPLNHSAHYFLSDYYLGQPRHEMARDSELLQAQLLQPLNANPAQPRLAGNGLGFLDHSDFRLGANEYSQLLTSQGVRGFVDVAAGGRGTYQSSVAASGLTPSASWSIGQSTIATDGFRTNNDQRLSVVDAFVQYDRSPQTSVQAELRSLTKNLGDTAITFFDADNASASARDVLKSDSVRLGLRHAWSPDSVLLASYVYRDQSDRLALPDSGFESTVTERVHQLELRGIQRGRLGSTTEGIGVLQGRSSSTDRIDPDPATLSTSTLSHLNAYAYHTRSVSPSLELTMGLSADAYRDSLVRRRQLNPKFGLLWNPSASTAVRVAAFRALKRSVATGQTIEPVSLVGFNQFFSGINDLNGTDNQRLGIAVDLKVSPSLWVGTEWSRRRIRLLSPQIYAADDLIFRETDWSGYLHWTPSKRSTLSVGIDRERLSSSGDELGPNLLREARTTTASAEWRLFSLDRWFSKVRLTRLLQDGQFFDLSTAAYAPGRSRGHLLDLGVGYRLPQRRGLVAVELRNALDDAFAFQETNPQNATFPRRRTAVVRLRLDF
jgi:tetratricopeptide (TPR) repeat protein